MFFFEFPEFSFTLSAFSISEKDISGNIGFFFRMLDECRINL